MKHTPGPWRVWEKGWGRFAVDAATREICAVWSRDDEMKTTAEANAKLIAAAPELLAACKAMESALAEVPCISNKQEASRIQARSAIAKAEAA